MIVAIRAWRPDDVPAVVDLIVGIQRGEFGFDITADDQPDLHDVEGFYLADGGRFWVAEDQYGRIVGTIAAKVLEAGSVALRKMFVDPAHRGDGLAAALMDELVEWARQSGHAEVVLGTTSVMHRAHRFYERNGFTAVAPDDLPSSFPLMTLDSVFYRLGIA